MKNIFGCSLHATHAMLIVRLCARHTKHPDRGRPHPVAYVARAMDCFHYVLHKPMMMTGG